MDDGEGRTVGDEAGTGRTCCCRIASSEVIYTPEYATDTLSEMLKFLPSMPEAHLGCTVLVSITCLNNGYLNNNQKKLCIYKITSKKAMASDITATDSGFGASAPKMLAIKS